MTSTVAPDFEMPVSSIFSIRGRGTIVAGVVHRGSVAIGDRLTVASPLASKVVVAAALERVGSRELLGTAKARDEIAILCRGLEVDDVKDGLERVDDHAWKVRSLRVRSPEPAELPWWRRIADWAGL